MLALRLMLLLYSRLRLWLANADRDGTILREYDRLKDLLQLRLTLTDRLRLKKTDVDIKRLVDRLTRCDAQTLSSRERSTLVLACCDSPCDTECQWIVE